mmetsp:Transcript_7826/g.19484  ORF Transcript_7826/g.19484 Transcript_7826/m.19484 type:complete len:357 (+) Transcript_7826:1460-2530(+)
MQRACCRPSVILLSLVAFLATHPQHSSARTALLRRLYPAAAALVGRVYEGDDDPRHAPEWADTRMEEAGNSEGVVRAYTAEEVWFDDRTAISSSLPTTMCLDEGWWAEGGHNARVACRQLGFTGGEVLGPDAYAEVGDDMAERYGVAITHVVCNGTEAKLEDCWWTYNTLDEDTDCLTGDVVAVRCWRDTQPQPQGAAAQGDPGSATSTQGGAANTTSLMVVVELNGTSHRAAGAVSADAAASFRASLRQALNDSLAALAANSSWAAQAHLLGGVSYEVVGFLQGPAVQPLLQLRAPAGNATALLNTMLDALARRPSTLLSASNGAKRFAVGYRVKAASVRRVLDAPAVLKHRMGR